MEYRKLGQTELDVSAIGFGCWAIGGHGYGKVNDRESVRAVRRALDHGINFFDTADVYGFGHSEEILAKALGPHRNKVVIATKFGMVQDKNGNIYRDCSPKRVVEAVERSLRRLKIDCIPLYQIHWHDNITPIYETMEALKKCQESGNIRYIGCCNFSTDLVREALKSHRIESLQCLYNIIERDRENDMLECYENFKMGIIVYGLLARGLMSGKYDINTKFGENDTRSRYKAFQGEEFNRNLQLIDKLRTIGMRYGKTSSQIAIRLVLDNPIITSTIIGHKTKEQVEENVLSLGWKLEQEDIDFIYRNINMYSDRYHLAVQ